LQYICDTRVFNIMQVIRHLLMRSWRILTMLSKCWKVLWNSLRFS